MSSSAPKRMPPAEEMASAMGRGGVTGIGSALITPANWEGSLEECAVSAQFPYQSGFDTFETGAFAQAVGEADFPILPRQIPFQPFEAAAGSEIHKQASRHPCCVRRSRSAAEWA